MGGSARERHEGLRKSPALSRISRRLDRGPNRDGDRDGRTHCISLGSDKTDRKGGSGGLTILLRAIALTILILTFSLATWSQPKPKPNHGCGQTPPSQAGLIAEAENEKLVIRRVEISGNSSIRHREFVKRLGSLQEGNIFSRASLEVAVRK